MKILRLAAGLLALNCAVSGRAGVSFQLYFDLVQTSVSGVPASVDTQYFLVVDTNGDGFASLQAGISFGAGFGDLTSQGLLADALSTPDDLLLFRGTLATAGNEPGIITASTPSLTLGTYGGRTWKVGDPLALLWFPGGTASFTGADSRVVSGASYGFARVSGTPSSGDVWTTPSDGTSLHALTLATTNAIGSTGTGAPALLVASSVVAIPEPASTAALAGVVALLVLAYRRRRG